MSSSLRKRMRSILSFNADDYEEQGACDYEGIPSGSLDGMCIDDDADDDNVDDLENMLKHFKADILFGM